MLKFEHTEILGWEHAIRGMRNPMNSWERSDSRWGCTIGKFDDSNCETCNLNKDNFCCGRGAFRIGSNDHDLMERLAKGGPVHAKYRRMIVVYVDITAPLYWWKEFDTYKVGTVANSCSTMHKITEKEFALEDFSHEHLIVAGLNSLKRTIDDLNSAREGYLDERIKQNPEWRKEVWWQMIQLLPSSYNQKRTVMLNYEVLANMYASRAKTPHKLDEWRVDFANWVESLPYSEIITGMSESKIIEEKIKKNYRL